MNALIKTLFGDARNISVVAGVALVAVALIALGEAAIAGYVVPPLTLAGIVWLARH
jgi:hypothetical protein